MHARSQAGSFSDQLVAILPRLRRFAHGLAGGAQDGDDLVQAACARALERSEQWQPGTRLDSWIYRIIQTIWLDRLRAGSVRETFMREDYAGPRAVDGERELDARMTLAQVRRIVDEMPAGYRSVVLLVCVEGLSYREAASVLGVPTGTIMSRLARARRTLSKRTYGRADYTGDGTEETPDGCTG